MNEKLASYFGYLENRLSVLSDGIKRMHPKAAEIELKKCEATLSNIQDLLRYQELNMVDYFSRILGLQDQMIEISYEVERKNNPWWKKAWNGLLKVFGLFFPRLM